MTFWELLSKILITKGAVVLVSMLAFISILCIGGFAYLAYEAAEPGTEVAILGLVKFTKATKKPTSEPLPAEGSTQTEPSLANDTSKTE